MRRRLVPEVLRAHGFEWLRGQGWVWLREEVGEDPLRLRVQLGGKRGKVTWTVKAPLGLDVYSFRLACWMVEDLLNGLDYGIRTFSEVFMVQNAEYLYDMMGIRLEGMKAVTVSSFDGELSKIYQKSYGVRYEARDSRPTSLSNVLALVQGGIPVNEVLQGVGVVHSDLGALTSAIKGQNRLINDMLKYVKPSVEAGPRFAEAIDKILDRLEDLEKKLSS